jgi:hypothetical protein
VRVAAAEPVAVRVFQTIRLRSLVRRRFERAAVRERAFGGRRLFFVVPPDERHRVAALLTAGRVEETLEQLARAEWLAAEVRYG